MLVQDFMTQVDEGKYDWILLMGKERVISYGSKNDLDELNEYLEKKVKFIFGKEKILILMTEDKDNG